MGSADDGAGAAAAAAENAEHVEQAGRAEQAEQAGRAEHAEHAEHAETAANAAPDHPDAGSAPRPEARAAGRPTAAPTLPGSPGSPGSPGRRPARRIRPGPNRPARRRRSLVGLWLIAPYAVYLSIVYAAPIVQGIRISFLDYIYAAPGASVSQPFVGLRNYRDALGDPLLRRSFLNILEFLAINVPLTVGLGLSLAAVLARLTRARALFRSAFFVPYVTASIAVIGVWYFLFSQSGLMNHVLGGLAPDPSWLVNSHFAMVVVALEVTWKQLGFYVLLYLAGILLIPDSLYEAAAIDGAGRIRQFRSITVPAVRTVTVLVATLAVIVGANLFTEPYLLTGGGGPNGATMSPALLIYQAGVEQGRPAVGAAIGMLLTVFVLLVAGLGRGVQRLVQGREDT